MRTRRLSSMGRNAFRVDSASNSPERRYTGAERIYNEPTPEQKLSLGAIDAALRAQQIMNEQGVSFEGALDIVDFDNELNSPDEQSEQAND